MPRTATPLGARPAAAASARAAARPPLGRLVRAAMSASAAAAGVGVSAETSACAAVVVARADARAAPARAAARAQAHARRPGAAAEAWRRDGGHGVIGARRRRRVPPRRPSGRRPPPAGRKVALRALGAADLARASIVRARGRRLVAVPAQMNRGPLCNLSRPPVLARDHATPRNCDVLTLAAPSSPSRRARRRVALGRGGERAVAAAGRRRLQQARQCRGRAAAATEAGRRLPSLAIRARRRRRARRCRRERGRR